MDLNGTLNVLQAEIHTDDTDATAATYIASILLCVLGTLMFAGTIYDVVFLQWPRWKEQMLEEQQKETRNGTTISNEEGKDEGEKENGTTLNGGATISIPQDGAQRSVSNTNSSVGSVRTSLNGGGRTKPSSHCNGYGSLTVGNNKKENKSPGKLLKVLVAFSVYTNGWKTLNTSQQSGSITCIHGMRFFSMTWVILCHIWIMPMPPGFYGEFLGPLTGSVA
ncbi:nose resistant to fluoxetine protein 6-like [Elysia marginata]|uniref:Nose resistant to fluoxetine protein 6-like n=1 Tax=Elysia marginata TaxID=1093978 RepID=A0AAV4G0I5_9GAST|nr:nose resistant to fluoxetine protein 6-like [Elysia marginata]